MALILLGALGAILCLGWLARSEPTPRDSLFLGGGVTAATMHHYAVNVGCPELYFQEGRDTLQDALHEIRRCGIGRCTPSSSEPAGSLGHTVLAASAKRSSAVRSSRPSSRRRAWRKVAR